jgi:hypothetical protein
MDIKLLGHLIIVQEGKYLSFTEAIFAGWWVPESISKVDVGR